MNTKTSFAVAFIVLFLWQGAALADLEFPPIPLRPPLPQNVLPDTQAFPPTRSKSARMKVPPTMTIKNLRDLTVVALSEACVHNRFNQKRKGTNFIVLNNPRGGIYKFDAASTRDGNLFDPLNKGLDRMLYVFEGDSTSQCRVYSIPYYLE